MAYVGELAGVATALLWAFTAMFFSEAGRLIGSFTVNKIRLLLAVFLYTGFLLLTTGSLYPQGVNEQQLFWLGLSGIVGLVIGDGCGFKALVMIGPRLTMLLYASAPIMTTIIAWIFLGEQLSFVDVIGIAITIGGISWVVLERRFDHNSQFNLRHDHPDRGSLMKGISLGLVAALGQASGLVLAKQGMLHAGGTVEPLQAAYIRMAVSLLVLWAITAVRGQMPKTIIAMKNKKALLLCVAGAVVGPFLGVWMSLVAVKYIAAGLAATLNSTTPVMILPLVVLWYKERVTLRATLGAVVTVCGVALIFLY
jgi:drug/metabolite transporter (DMT)-like permease